MQARSRSLALVGALGFVGTLRAQVMPEPDETPRLMELLRSGDPQIRRLAVAALTPRDPRVVVPMLKALDDSDPAVRRRTQIAFLAPDRQEPRGWRVGEPRDAMNDPLPGFAWTSDLLEGHPHLAAAAKAVNAAVAKPPRIWPGRAIAAALTDALGNPDASREERLRACLALAAIGEDARPAASALARTLDGCTNLDDAGEHELARAAYFALASQSDPAHADALVAESPRWCESDDPEDRLLSFAALRRIGAAASPLATDVVRAFERTLGPSPIIERSRDATKERSIEFAFEILDAIGEAAAPVIPRLLPLLEAREADGDGPWKQEVLKLLPSLGPAAGSMVAPLLGVIDRGKADVEDRSPETASEALHALGPVAEGAVEAWVARRVHDTAPLPAADPAWDFLGFVADSDPGRKMIGQLIDVGSPREAEYTLKRLGAAAAPFISRLLHRIDDGDHYARRAALSVVFELDPSLETCWIPRLLDLLEDEDSAVVSMAWHCLAHIGPAAAAAAPFPEWLLDPRFHEAPHFERDALLRRAGEFGVAALPWLRGRIEHPDSPQSRLLAVESLRAPAMAVSAEAQRYVRELFDRTDDPELHQAVLELFWNYREVADATRFRWTADVAPGAGREVVGLLSRFGGTPEDFARVVATLRGRWRECDLYRLSGDFPAFPGAELLFLEAARAHDGMEWERIGAVHWLAAHAMGSDAVVEGLARLMEDEEDEMPVRCAAAAALGRISVGSERWVSRVAAACRSLAPELRRAAWGTLRSLTLAAASTGTAIADPSAISDDLPPTAAEASKFERTSTSAEVESYVDRCVAANSKLVRLSMGKTTENKDLPLVLVADPPVKSIAEARAQSAAAKRPLVFVMANIHAGEVEGKEAVQILLREFAQGGHDELLKTLTLAFVPDYNPDGNDKLDRKSRPDQAGPNEGVGQRANGQGFDLNRDYVKVEAPETKALLAAVDALDPVLVMDLHTTDGCFHGYDLTYAGIMHPACDPELLRFTRETLLPSVQAAMKTKGFATFDYGDFDDNAHPEKGWSSFESKPRYGTNYFGFQNRLTLLSEAYSHAPFAERVKSTHAFVLTALEFARDHAAELVKLRRDADDRGRSLAASATPISLPTRGEMAKTRDDDDVLVGAVTAEKDPVTGLEHMVTTHESHAVRMPVHVTFEGRDDHALPRAFIVARPSDRLLDLVARHGLSFERLAVPRRAHLRLFTNAERTESKRPFQGHALATFTGTDVERDLELPAGALVVPTTQPRSRLAFVLFSPTSDDGLGTWGVVNLEPDDSGSRFEAMQLLDWR